MATRADREKLQSQNNRHKEILAKMLAKEENKFCADCLSKGPRWVSWNLGIFVCIRCSGIHRSLGVHISKVKSVNLDTWTPDQMASVCKRGNGWAKDNYEARLPKDYPRPQNDSSMEYFIRDKYENKKYSSSTPIPLRSLQGLYDEEKGEPVKKPTRGNVVLSAGKKSAPPSKLSPVPRRQAAKPAAQPKPTTTAVDDLLGLHSPVKQATTSSVTASSVATTQPPSADLTFDLFQSAPSANPPPSSAFQNKEDSTTTTTGGKSVMSKDSILSLYSQNPAPLPTPNNTFISPTNQFGGMAPAHRGPALQRVPQAPAFPATNPYTFQQQPAAQIQAGMMYNQQQQPFAQQPPPQPQFQWQQQAQQQTPLHMQMSSMTMNGGGRIGSMQAFGLPQQAQQQQQQQQQANNMFRPPQQQMAFAQQQQQGFATTQQQQQQQVFNNGGGFGQAAQPQLTWEQRAAWQQNNGGGGQTLSNHLWK